MKTTQELTEKIIALINTRLFECESQSAFIHLPKIAYWCKMCGALVTHPEAHNSYVNGIHGPYIELKLSPTE